jgi:hypothetical protein
VRLALLIRGAPTIDPVTSRAESGIVLPMSRMLAVLALVLSIGTVAAVMVLLSRPIPVVISPAWYLGALTVAAVLAGIAVARTWRWLPATALLVSLLLLGVAGLFNFVLARVPVPRAAFAVGQPAPDFALPDATGETVRLSDYRGRNAVVLVFYRGYW